MSIRSYRSDNIGLQTVWHLSFKLKEVAGFHWVHVPPPLRIRESVKNDDTKESILCQCTP
ncbi:hypothetical protein GCM10010896_08990 [Mammaliicoccus stepanovicii]|nr:hypothetical protein GCM10010896_08990 [Mammaliicoccus stepanovicii]